MDDGIGRILDTLDEAGIADDTLVWFLSDNGGTGALLANNRPLRGNKHDVYEGGVRVPSCLRSPARLPGGRRLGAPIAAIDVMPTLIQAAGLVQQGGKPLDGLELLEVLLGERPAPERELFFYFGQDGPQRERLALLAPPWKLVLLGPDVRSGAVDSRHSRLLFDVLADPSENHDLAAEHPEVVQALTRRLVDFRRQQPAQGVVPYEQAAPASCPPRTGASARPGERGCGNPRPHSGDQGCGPRRRAFKGRSRAAPASRPGSGLPSLEDPMRPDPIPAVPTTIAAVLDWLERRVDGVSVTDDPWGVQVTREMICTLRQGGRRGAARAGLEPPRAGRRGRSGPGHVLDGRSRAGLPVQAAGASGGEPRRPPGRRTRGRRPGGETHPDW